MFQSLTFWLQRHHVFPDQTEKRTEQQVRTCVKMNGIQNANAHTITTDKTPPAAAPPPAAEGKRAKKEAPIFYAVSFFYRRNHRRLCRSFSWLSNKILNMCTE